jgi:hypothetical protein
MTKPFSNDLFDRLVKLGLELIDTGYATLCREMQGDTIHNVKHLVHHQGDWVELLFP